MLLESPLTICYLSSSQVMKSVKEDTPGGSTNLYALYWIQKMTGVLIRCINQLQTQRYMTAVNMKPKVVILDFYFSYKYLRRIDLMSFAEQFSY